MWEEPYHKRECKKAWKLYYSNFDSNDFITLRKASILAGVNYAEMICYGFHIY